jgi:hypothetical protein
MTVIEGTTARWDGYLEFQRRPQPMLPQRPGAAGAVSGPPVTVSRPWLSHTE